MAATVRPITLGRYSDSVDAKDDEVTLLDNKKIYLGTGSDLQLVHDGSNSIINDAGTGNLKLQVGGSDKLEVTSTGISVTGDISATGTIPASVCTNNLIINGGMVIDQRESGSAHSPSTSGYTLDRWKILFGGNDENPTVQKHTLTKADDALPWAAGLRFSMLVTNGNQTSGTGASDYVGIAQHIEARNIVNSGWDYNNTSDYITLSFWVKSSVAQNMYGYVKSQDGTQQTWPFETGSLTADTWTKITKTVPGHASIQVDHNSNAGFSFFLNPYYGTSYTGTVSLNQWSAYSGSARTPDYGTDNDDWYLTNDATLEVTGVQLELGQVANDFKYEPFSETLQKCQRYFWRFNLDDEYTFVCDVNCHSASNAYGGVIFPVEMRGIGAALTKHETYTDWQMYEGGNERDVTAIGTTGIAGKQSAQIRVTTNETMTQGNGGWFRAGNNTNCWLAWDVEI
jgi:hypothetical protein